MGPYFPDQGLNPCSLHWSVVLITGPQGKPLGTCVTYTITLMQASPWEGTNLERRLSYADKRAPGWVMIQDRWRLERKTENSQLRKKAFIKGGKVELGVTNPLRTRSHTESWLRSEEGWQQAGKWSRGWARVSSVTLWLRTYIKLGFHCCVLMAAQVWQPASDDSMELGRTR